MHTFFSSIIISRAFLSTKGRSDFRFQALPSINKNNRKITFTFDQIVLFTFLFGYYYSVHINHFFFLFKERRAIVFLYHRFVMTNSVESSLCGFDRCFDACDSKVFDCIESCISKQRYFIGNIVEGIGKSAIASELTRGENMMHTQQHYKPSHFIYRKCLLHLIRFA